MQELPSETPDLEGLLGRLDVISRDILKLSGQGKKILVVTHIDADGLTSGSIVFASLARKGGNIAIRSVQDLDPHTIEVLQGQGYDFLIFTDLGSALVTELERAFDGRFLVIDHHQLADSDLRNSSVVNAWQYSYDGGREACSSAMAYLFAIAVDATNRDLSYLAVVGAVADRQDSGPGRALTAINRRALEDAQSAGLVTVTKDLTLTGRETRPVHEAVALTSNPFLPGLSGSKDAVLAALLQAGLKLKEGSRWRTASELSTEERMRLTDVIAAALGAREGATDALVGLIGEVYTCVCEDSFTPLRDAREFATLLNACGRMDAAGIGIAICLGERGAALKTAMQILSEYRLKINSAIQGLFADTSRIQEHGSVVLLRGERLVDEKLLGPVTSIIASSPTFRDKVVIGSSSSGESELKISSRVGDSFQGSVNLGLVMRAAAEAVKGVGGGHSMAAGAKIPSSAADAFSKIVLEKVQS